MKILKTLFAIAILSVSFSCSKPEDGKDGKDGIAGIAGTNGTTGTANVIYSNWINPTFTNSNPTTAVALITEPKITQEILDKGTILVYAKSGTEIYLLNYYNPAVSYSLINNCSIGQIKIVEFYATRVFNQFRYVIIPGGVSSARSSNALDYKSMTYNQVCTSLNITEK